MTVEPLLIPETIQVSSADLSVHSLKSADQQPDTTLIWASILASTVTKRSSALAFSNKKRSTTSPDIIEYIGQAFEDSIDNICTN